ncbi:short chain dehydrogenase/reductase [Cordyceps fumosorosea ARSEF 2679]|uniref:Short chain dehydrogenase/reductase n=1 Tax=Cordyceps fumosorosea (strain ARSEF 2679) TaxID=1081104 RepID=A0A167U9U3_CORFA|nr:short chain dehydrogenase/reductase [Cordyceps fumosorosea ARSEF 2679]OAA61364.1 short chain dehydrogenase/reductase [Cordyceps fumosorosea ARSEF 2679]
MNTTADSSRLGGLLAAVGLLTAVVAVTRALQFVSVYLLPSRIARYAHSTNGQPPWALVTGASDGIGRGFAAELAKQGFNVVLHGRNRAKLTSVMSLLRERHPDRSFRILIADASRVACLNCIRPAQGQSHTHEPDEAVAAASPTDFDALRTALDGLNLTVLVNNAGGGAVNPTFLSLGESSEARITGNVSLNALFPLHLTRALLPTLRRNSPSLVLNVSSLADNGLPLLVSYCASKRFLLTMTEAVVREMKLLGRGGDVELLGIRVGKTTNTAYFTEKPSFFTPDSQTMARAALEKAGYGHGVVVGYWAHALQHILIKAMPLWVKDRAFIAAVQMEAANDRKTT